jgi:hypothetical protein
MLHRRAGRHCNQRLTLWRHERAGPVLAELKAWSDEQHGRALPKSLLAQAMG